MQRTPILLLLLLGALAAPAHADIVWTGATSNDIFDEANWDLSNSTVTVVDPNVTIDDNVVIANAVAPLELPDIGGQVRFQVGDGFTITLDGSTLLALGNDGIGGVPATVVGPAVNVVNGGHLNVFFITNRVHLDLDSSSDATLRGPATPVNGSTVDVTLGAVLAFPDETVADYINEHLSKTTVDDAPAVVDVNLQVVSDGGTGCIVTALFMGPVGMNYCGPAIPNSTGMAGTISGAGSPVVADGDLTLTAEFLPPGQFGYFLAGRTQGFFNPPGSSGFICLSGQIGRYNRASEIIQGPTGSLALDLTAMPFSPPQPAVAGETWYFQCWYRETGSSNFTDGLQVDFL